MSSKMVLDAIGYNPAKAGSFAAPVQNVTALTALLSTTLEDKQLRLSEDEGRIYRYDAQSVLVADGIKTILPVNLTAAIAGRWILQSVNDHSQLINLTADDHKQYIHNTVARIITAMHTFNPAAAGPPFALGVNALTQKVVGLNADLLDGKSAEEFILTTLLGAVNGVATLGADGKVLPTELLKLTNGMPAYKEPISGATVSIDSTSVEFALVSAGTRNVYLNLSGIASNTLGYHVPRNAMITAITVSSSTTMTASTGCSLQLRKNDLTTPFVTAAIASGLSFKIYTGLSILLNAGDEIQAYIAATLTVANPSLTLELVWRD